MWTYMHLRHPHRGDGNSGILHRMLSPPKQNPDSNNRLIFSIFYSAILVFPAIVSLGHWAVIAPQKQERTGENGRK
jgi:hypothetical protein